MVWDRKMDKRIEKAITEAITTALTKPTKSKPSTKARRVIEAIDEAFAEMQPAIVESVRRGLARKGATVQTEFAAITPFLQEALVRTLADKGLLGVGEIRESGTVRETAGGSLTAEDLAAAVKRGIEEAQPPKTLHTFDKGFRSLAAAHAVAVLPDSAHSPSNARAQWSGVKGVDPAAGT